MAGQAPNCLVARPGQNGGLAGTDGNAVNQDFSIGQGRKHLDGKIAGAHTASP